MKRVVGVLILMLLLAASLAGLRLRDRWIDGALAEQRARRIESTVPRWPDLGSSLNGGGSVRADDD